VSIKGSAPRNGSQKQGDKELTTLFTGRLSRLLPETDSTNARMAEWIRHEPVPEGAAVRALRQTAGRGQRGAAWESDPGKNLLQSFVFYPTFVDAKCIFLLNKTFSLGVYDFVRDFLGEHVSVKWPNDIYFRTKKVAGILLENTLSGPTLTSSILGIGINVNQHDFSPALPNPASFSSITGMAYTLDLLFNSLCASIERRYLLLRNGGHQKIEADYLEVLYGFGKPRTFESSGQQFTAIIRGVDDAGRLLVEQDQKDLLRFDLKEITFL
jgi:BirA family biotin operon repressor/biotin-[acetyl-CoA-carboxylase] ligase